MGLIKSSEKAPAALCRLGIGQGFLSPIWAISSESWVWFHRIFLSVYEAGDGVSLVAHSCPASGSLSASILLFFFLSPCCSSESLGELSISRLVLLSPDPGCGLWMQEEEELRGSL